MDTSVIRDVLVSHAAKLGRFERVNGQELTNSPGNGLTASVWSDSIDPVPSGSGLASTTARVLFMVRGYSAALQLPHDEIDPNLDAAIDALFTAYSGDFELGGNVRNIDLLGQAGVAMSAKAGWVTFPDGGPLYRVKTITVPVLVNDAWTQAP